jgi:hypothetical protein
MQNVYEVGVGSELVGCISSKIIDEDGMRPVITP